MKYFPVAIIFALLPLLCFGQDQDDYWSRNDIDTPFVCIKGLDSGYVSSFTNYDVRKMSIKQCDLSQELLIGRLRKLKSCLIANNLFKGITIYNCKMKYLYDHDNNNLGSYIIQHSELKKVIITGSNFMNSSYEDIIADTLFFEKCLFSQTTKMTDVKARKIQVSDCWIKDNFKIRLSEGIESIYLTGNKINDGALLDLSDVNYYTFNKEIKLFISPDQIPKLKLNYAYFKLKDNQYQYFHYPVSYMSNLYELLLRSQKDYGFNDGYEKLDIEYHNYKLRHSWNLQDFFSKHWWNYGYNKEYVFTWTWGLFLIFYLITFIFLSTLLDNVYTIDNLKEKWDAENDPSAYAARRLWLRIWITFLYSSIIFFGIKIDIDKFKFDRIGVVIFIYFFYLSGLVCLLFIGNYILLK